MSRQDRSSEVPQRSGRFLLRWRLAHSAGWFLASRRQVLCDSEPMGAKESMPCRRRRGRNRTSQPLLARGRLLLWILLLVAFGSPPSATESFPQDKADDVAWHTLEGGPFVVNFPEADHRTAEKVLASLQAVYPQLAASFGAELRPPTRVYIAPSQDVFDGFTGGVVPHWGEAVADLRRRLIVLKSPRWSQPTRQLHILVVHELTHLLLAEALDGAQAPRWFNEGLAIYYAKDPSYAAATLVSRALLSGEVIPLERIDDLLNFHQAKAQLAYQESYLAVRFIIERWGPEGLRRLVGAMRRSPDLDTSFKAALGIDFVDFQTDWYDFIRKHYRWNFLLEFDTYIWFLILFLFIAAFIAIRYRNRRTLQRWQREERLSGTFE